VAFTINNEVYLRASPQKVFFSYPVCVWTGVTQLLINVGR